MIFRTAKNTRKLMLPALIPIIFTTLGISQVCCAQTHLTLDYCTNVLAPDSPQAIMKRNEYANALLEFENYKKSLLPAIALTTNPFTFNRSMKLIQQASDGVYHNIDDYTFSSDIGLSVRQTVGFTGGTLSVTSSLNYLNEFNVNTHSFSTTPQWFIEKSVESFNYRDFYLAVTSNQKNISDSDF